MFVIDYLFYCLAVILIFQFGCYLQRQTKQVWLNPFITSLIIIVPILNHYQISFTTFEQNTQWLSWLIEPAIVALGLPLYQHLSTIKKEFKQIVIILIIAITLVLVISTTVSMLIVGQSDISVSLALKSITTPIGLALTEKLNGVNSITAIAIIIAGMTGAIWGIKTLNLFQVTCPKAQGLAIGCGSHALGTSTISSLSYQHSAYSSLSLVLCAILTSFIAPIIIPFILNFL